MTVERDLFLQDLERKVLDLREVLVRHDENLKAWHLLNAVPYIVWDRPAIAKARADQREMVLHALEPDAYADYYAHNPHERPFEEQYGIAPEVAHEHLYRVAFLRQGLEAQRGERPASELDILDCSANDGWMAQNLHELGYQVDCLDLNPDCVRRASLRPGVNGAEVRDFRKVMEHGNYDAVVLFETIEHLPDPSEALRRAAEYAKGGDGRLYVSTPEGAVERGDLPNWAHVERKGHLHAFRREDFEELLAEVGTVERLIVGPDNVMCAELSPKPAG